MFRTASLQDPVVLLQNPLVHRLLPKPVLTGDVLQPVARTSSADSRIARSFGFSYGFLSPPVFVLSFIRFQTPVDRPVLRS